MRVQRAIEWIEDEDGRVRAQFRVGDKPPIPVEGWNIWLWMENETTHMTTGKPKKQVKRGASSRDRRDREGEAQRLGVEVAG